MIRIEIGEYLPIALQVAGGEETLFPQVVLTDKDGLEIETLDLVHRLNGLYLYDTPYTMNTESIIYATYIVYTDSYGGTESGIYSRVLDTFYRSNIKATVNQVPFEAAQLTWQLELDDCDLGTMGYYVIDTNENVHDIRDIDIGNIEDAVESIQETADEFLEQTTTIIEKLTTVITKIKQLIQLSFTK
jgi:hypothetical protein